MYRYAILGSVELRDGGDQPLAVGGPGQVALLAFLLVHANRLVTTDALDEALWGDERAAPKRLQMAVGRLRRTLEPIGDPLLTVSGGYRLAVSPGELDSDAFQAALEAGRGALEAGEPVRARVQLQRALDLWRGPALTDVAYASFAQGEIRRLEELRLGALEARVEADLELGRHGELIAELEALLAAHPLRERLARQLMLAYYRCDRQTDALEVYGTAQRRLDEIGLTPGPALSALQQQILGHASSLRPAAPRERTPPLPDALRSPADAFVGRVEERAMLLDVVRAARGGSRRVVFLHGEPGAGKTRLAAETAFAAHASGFRVGWGAAADGLRPPYGPWIGALDHLVEHAPDEVLARHVADHRGELSRLVRSLEARVPAPQRSDPETERYLLYAAVAGLLAELSAAAPVAVVLDDLQWADRESLELLAHVTAATPRSRLLVLATYRDSEPGALRGVLADLVRVPGVERHEVTGLAVDDVAELMTVRSGLHIDHEGRRLAAAITAETDGNPFFVGELLRHLDESGGGALALPQSVREVVRRRVERLGEAAHGILSVAAVVGQTVELALLERLAPATEDALLAALEAAVAGALMTEASDGRFAFAHALINHTLYEDIGATRRSRLHGRVAEALEALAPGDHGALAHHWALAGSPKAIGHARLAGVHALEQLAPDEALRRLEQAVALLRRHGGDEDEWCDVLIGLGEARRQLGVRTFRNPLVKAARIAARRGDDERLSRAVLANTLGPFGAAGPPDRLRRRALEDALERLPADWPRRPRIMAVLAKERYYGGDPGPGSELSLRALEAALRSDDRRELARVMATATAISPIAPLEVHAALTRRLAALGDEIDDPELRFQAANAAFIFGMHSGDRVQLESGLKVMLDLARAIGQPILRWTALWAHSARRTLAGDLAGGEALAKEADLVARRQGRAQGALITFGQLLGIRTEQGRLDELRAPLEHVIARNPRLPVLRLARGFIDAETGHLDGAAAVLEATAAEGFRFPFDRTLAFSLARCADLALRVGAPGIAEDLYDRLLPYQDQFATPAGISSRGSIALNLGRLAALLGDEAAAGDHLAEARRAHERLKAPLLQARTSLALGEALLRRGRSPAEPLAEAVALARRYGSVAIEREAGALLVAARH